MNKIEWRRELRARRMAFVTARGGNHFAPSLTTAPIDRWCASDEIIAIYQANRDECSCRFLMHDPSLTLALPCANSKEERLIFRQWAFGEPLEMSPLGFLQPLEAAPAIAPTIIFTPLLGFDRALNRLGQGAGHYDRAFKDHPDAIRIGFGWSVQEVGYLTPDPWDVSLDAVLTEREWMTSTSSRLETLL